MPLLSNINGTSSHLLKPYMVIKNDSNAYLTYEIIAIGFKKSGSLLILAKKPLIKKTGAIDNGAIKTAVSTDLT